jgi:sirohydrochlorin ferrochelatase
MLGRMVRAVATRLARERALKVSAAIWLLAVMAIVLLRVAGPDDDVESFALGMALAVPMLVVVPILGLTALHAAWVVPRAIADAGRQELRVRALGTDSHSDYGLPGFPDMEAGGGDLSETERGGLAVDVTLEDAEAADE